MSFASDLAEAAAEFIAETGEAVTVGGVAKTATYSDASVDEIVIAGGESDAGGFKLSILKTDFASRPSTDGTVAVTARGRTMELLQINPEGVAHYSLICGKAAAQ